MKKKVYFLVIGLFALCSCTKQNTISQWPVEKLYILEYTYALHPVETDRDTAYFEFRVVGYSELDEAFNLKYARRLFWDIPYYCDLKTVIPDSMKLKISTIISNYQKDTTFLYQGEIGGRIYDGNAYQLMIQRKTAKVVVSFEPTFLPDDLKFLYDYLYHNRDRTTPEIEYKEIFEMFKREVHDESRFPLPQPKGTIKFTPPKIY